MKKYPFKFLDSYNRNDKGIFFGRDEEIDALYEMVFQTSVILVYGASGTGKTSLINCGLAGRFQPHDWLPLMIRRANNINDSLVKALGDAGGSKSAQQNVVNRFSDWEEEAETDLLNPVCKSIKAVYQKSFRPVFLIFDQFEELFILGSIREQREFIETIQDILKSDLQVKLIFTIREEYLGYLFEFERRVPQLLRKKLRVEPMNLEKVKQVIVGVSEYEASNVKLRSGESEQVAKGIFDKIKGKGKTLTIQLPFLQVFLDKFYLNITGDESRKAEAEFSMEALSRMEEIDDVLIDFLEEQVEGISKKLQLEFPALTTDRTWKILSPFSTLEGTKEPIGIKGLFDRLPDFDQTIVKKVIDEFFVCRILRFNETTEMFEIAHDCLARPIADKRTVEENANLEIKRLISGQVSVKPEAREHFTEKQLLFIEPYLEKFKASEEELRWITASRGRIQEQKESEKNKQLEELAKTEKRLRNVRALLGLAIIAIIAAIYFNIAAARQRRIAEDEKQKALSSADQENKQKIIAETQKTTAEYNARRADTLKSAAESSALNAEREKQNALKSATEAKKHRDIAKREQATAEFNARQADSLKSVAESNAQVARREEQKAIDYAEEAKRKTAEAELQKELANSRLNDILKLRETEVGARYQGGIVASAWTDTNGKKNVLIAAEKDLGMFTWKEAIDTCRKLILNEYDDWILPTRPQLGILYANRDMIGGFIPTHYWCSDQAGSLQVHAWSAIFTTGYPKGRSKKIKSMVRPVRLIKIDDERSH